MLSSSLTLSLLYREANNSSGLPCVDEPGKQVKSAIRIKNTSKSHVAFKVSIDYCFAISPTADRLTI